MDTDSIQPTMLGNPRGLRLLADKALALTYTTPIREKCMELEHTFAALEQVEIKEDIEVPNTESQVRKLKQEFATLTHQLQRMTTAIPGEIDKRIRSAAQLRLCLRTGCPRMHQYQGEST